jgi:cation:H+ antiporter
MTAILQFIVGLAGLIAGAELLVRGASRLALALGISPLVVGLTVVAFGTSAPEMAVSVGAVIAGRTDLALGNAVGSNIFNVLLILGLAALVAPLAVHVQVIRQEAPIMLGAAVLLIVLCLDGVIGGFDGALLCGLMLAYTAFLVRQARAQPPSTHDQYAAGLPAAAAGDWRSRRAVQVLMIVAGLALLVGGSDALVRAAVAFARVFGVSEVVIGLTIVAAGTSLPEVATSVAAALKGERDIAVGNVVGSCVFNLLAVVGLGALAAVGSSQPGLPVPSAVLNFDLWVMLAVFLACLPVFMTGREIARWEGALFLAYYAAYVCYLILAAKEHDALPVFSAAMLGFVLPLTIVTLVVVGLRERD